jgi:hypothetical protein
MELRSRIDIRGHDESECTVCDSTGINNGPQVSIFASENQCSRLTGVLGGGQRMEIVKFQ